MFTTSRSLQIKGILFKGPNFDLAYTGKISHATEMPSKNAFSN
uniref:Uncharacterized protein n=1 Tax=Rhizophora mucronata TaxID=61149 RepID=A0A2P2PDA7_RHIMU